MPKRKPVTIGPVTFGVPIRESDIKRGLPISEMFKLMEKASKENLLKPKDDVCFN